MPTAASTSRAKKAPLPSVFQNALGVFVGLYLIISLIATMFQVESAWSWPADILDLVIHMVSDVCIFPGTHS